VEYLRKTYCLDDTRIFSVGKSYGGLFSNTLGCEMGDVFRAIAPQSSWLPSPLGTCVGQPAVFIDHGNTDSTIEFSRGKAARDLWLRTNHCAATTKPWDQPDTTCVAYDGCDADKPVVWCEFDGGHVMPSWASAAVWKFLMQF
jgi:poly(3-hydroxybutyrate) depolymerase